MGGAVIAVWLLAAALAQDVPGDAGPTDPEVPEEGDVDDTDPPEPAAPVEGDVDDADVRVTDEGVLEVTVWGELAVREARDEVVREMRRLGWKKRDANNGDLVFRPPRGWMGRARLTREGLLTFGTPVVAWQRAQLAGADEEHDPFWELEGNAESGGAVEARLYVLPSRRKREAVQVRLLEEIGPELDLYRLTIQETEFRDQLYALPTELDALWEDGVPLEGVGLVDGAAARRAQVLDYWAGLASTREGEELSRAVELWLAETVMTSPDPVTAEEQAAANAARGGDRKLALVP